MKIREHLKYYKTQKDGIDELMRLVNRKKREMDKTKESIIKEMDANGVKRVTDKDETFEARMNVRKGLKVVERNKTVMWMRREKVDQSAYMDVSMTKLNIVAKRMVKDGKEVDGVEESESRYLSLKEL